VNDEDLLQTLETARESDFRPEFLQQMKTLLQLIYKEVTPKRLYGHFVTGRMLGELAKSYVNSINSGGVPTISSAWESVVQIEGAKAQEAALQVYETKMEEFIKAEPIMESERLREKHNEATHEAVDLFRKKAVGDNVRSFEDDLNASIQKSFAAKELENWNRSTQFCQEVVRKVFKALSQSVADGTITKQDQLENGWQNLLKSYEKDAKGPAKYREFFKAADQLLDPARKVTEAEIALSEDKAQKKLLEEKEKTKKEYERLEKLYATVDQEWKKSEEENKALKAENKNLIQEAAQNAKKVKDVDALQLEIAQLKKRINELEPKLEASQKKERELMEIQEKDGENKKKKKDKGGCNVM